MRSVLILLLVFSSLSAFGDNFPRPATLEPAVNFWTKVYTEVTTNQGYLHDAVNLSVVYESIDLPAYASRGAREGIVNHKKWAYERALKNLASGKRSNLDSTEAKALAAWPRDTPSSTFKNAAREIRFQLGQSDRFKEGLIRSGQWRPHIRRTLAMHNLPEELEVLPHVESSFNPNAYSHAAAAGMWQFMPATARQYMRVDHILDERMDPFIATEGAAKLLKRNYEITGTWPLALTAYNHGAGGITRAARAMGTRDIGVIAKGYKGPSFGFASRNFYASFLAALHVDRNSEQYFGKVTFQTPIDYDTVSVHEYIPVAAIAQSAGVSLDELKAHNPALRDAIWSGEKYIPRGYTVRIPKENLTNPLEAAIAAIPQSLRLGYQKPDVVHRIAPGESLSVIARRYNTSVSRLMALNGMNNANRIRAGQTLRLPGNAQAEPAMVAATAASQTARPQPVSSGASGGGVYVIRQGDSLWSIARRLNVSQSELVAWNGITNKNHIKPGQTLRIGAGGVPAGYQSYVIQPGDSLWAIAKKFNISQRDILLWNNLKNSHVIRAGQTIRLASN